MRVGYLSAIDTAPRLTLSIILYELLSTGGGYCTLQRALDDWRAAVEMVSNFERIVSDQQRGEMSIIDGVRVVAHDVFHHLFDIKRSIAYGG